MAAPVRVSEADDPVAAVLLARTEGRQIALATSGTTGVARWVERTTDSWWASFPAYSRLSGVTAGARVWAPGPLAATMNLFAAVHAHSVGAVLVDRPGDATHAVLTPAVLLEALDRLPARARVTVAGAALAPALADRAELAGLEVAHYYGAGELSFVACGRDSSTLVPFDGVEVEVRAGVVWVRSPYLCSRVVGAPRGFTDVASWATVGDLGALHGGRLELLGRPDTVSTGGATVLLAEVERALGGGVTCFGVPHPRFGEVIAAAVPSPEAVAELKVLARARLAPSHRPRVWLVAAPLPLTAAGKPDRAALVARVLASRPQPTSRNR